MYFYFIKKLITCTTDICINMPNKSNNVRLISEVFKTTSLVIIYRSMLIHIKIVKFYKLLSLNTPASQDVAYINLWKSNLNFFTGSLY